MAKGEKLFQASERNSLSTIVYGGRQIPFAWYNHPDIAPAFDRQVDLMLAEGPGILESRNVPETVSRMFGQTETMEATKHALFPGDPLITGLDAMHLQMGKKAYILLGQMRTEAGSAPFAIHLGRNPIDSNMGDEAARDFHDLSFLSQKAEEKIPPSLKNKYRFLKPTALGSPVTSQGRPYSWFTMPFIDDYGELKVDLVEVPGTGVRTSYFRHSLTHDEQTEGLSRRYRNNAGKLLQGMIKVLQRGSGTQEQIAAQLEKLPEAGMIFQQFDDLLLGNALVYLLSDGHFPADFAVNAGDWMVKFINDRLHLFLITVRGGWKEMPDDEAWVHEMMEHVEPLSNIDRHDVGLPLFYGREAYVRKALAKAKKLLKM